MDLSELNVRFKAGAPTIIYKTIRLFGREWEVPKDAKFISVDKDGDVHIWKAAPSTERVPWSVGWDCGGTGDTLTHLEQLGTIVMKPEYNWKEMIMEIQDEV